MEKYFVLDFWTIWAFLAEGLFFGSFLVQWYKSEKEQKSHLPDEFWYLRLLGSLMLIFYFIKRRELVLFIATILQTVIYVRNIYLSHHGKKVKD